MCATKNDLARKFPRTHSGSSGMEKTVCCARGRGVSLILVDNVRNTSYVIRTNTNQKYHASSSSQSYLKTKIPQNRT